MQPATSTQRTSTFVKDPVLGVSEEAHRAFPRMYRCLMAVCLLATARKLEDDASIVHEALERALVDPSSLHFGRAMARARAGDASTAVAMFDAELEADSEDHAAKVLKGGALWLARSPGWQQPLHEVLAVSTDQALRAAALDLLASPDRSLKKGAATSSRRTDFRYT